MKNTILVILGVLILAMVVTMVARERQFHDTGIEFTRVKMELSSTKAKLTEIKTAALRADRRMPLDTAVAMALQEALWKTAPSGQVVTGNAWKGTITFQVLSEPQGEVINEGILATFSPEIQDNFFTERDGGKVPPQIFYILCQEGFSACPNKTR